MRIYVPSYSGSVLLSIRLPPSLTVAMEVLLPCTVAAPSIAGRWWLRHPSHHQMALLTAAGGKILIVIWLEDPCGPPQPMVEPCPRHFSYPNQKCASRNRGRTEGTPPKAYPSRPWANLASPKPPKRTSAKSGDFDEGKRKVYEAALAEPEPVHFPPLKLSPARSTNPDPEQASTNGGKLRRRRAGSTKATELKRTLSKVRGAVAPWGRSLTFAPKERGSLQTLNLLNPTRKPAKRPVLRILRHVPKMVLQTEDPPIFLRA